MELETKLLTLQELLELAKKVPFWEEEDPGVIMFHYRGNVDGITVHISYRKLEERHIRYVLSANCEDLFLGQAVYEPKEGLIRLGPIKDLYSHVEFPNEQRRKEAINSARELLKE